MMKRRHPRRDALFGRYRWYRWLVGGHWEHWHVTAPLSGTIWLPLAICSYRLRCPPATYYVGEPRCEEYPDRGYWQRAEVG